MSSPSQTSFPSLPALYFKDQRTPKSSTALGSDLDSSLENGAFDEAMPAEVLQLCLVEYSSWGDLAKLACVQSSWKDLVADAANMSQEAKWDLSQALLRGESGLEANPRLALQYLLELSNTEVDAANLPAQKHTDNKTDTTPTTPFAPAMREIANLYLNGEGVEQDSAKGVAWLKASHEDGHDDDAAFQLAQIYEYGRHETEIDVYAAFEWFKKAANSGHVEAMTELALCYELGCGTEQSDEQALDYYMKAAHAGHANAKFSVGEAFEEARGVPQSDEEACLWYYKAALEGDEDSKQALLRLRDIARIVCPGVGRLLEA